MRNPVYRRRNIRNVGFVRRFIDFNRKLFFKKIAIERLEKKKKKKKSLG